MVLFATNILKQKISNDNHLIVRKKQFQYIMRKRFQFITSETLAIMPINMFKNPNKGRDK